MNVKDIILEKIEAVGADGLCIFDCGCSKDDLFACGYPGKDCMLASSFVAKDRCTLENCNPCNCDFEGYCEGYEVDKNSIIYVPFGDERLKK